jgi:hypothetical protein
MTTHFLNEFWNVAPSGIYLSPTEIPVMVHFPLPLLAVEMLMNIIKARDHGLLQMILHQVTGKWTFL